MRHDCKAKKFADRMSFKPKHAGKAVGEVRRGSGRHGVTEGEAKMGLSALNKDLTAMPSKHRS